MIYGARFMRANKSAVQMHTRECASSARPTQNNKNNQLAYAFSPDFTPSAHIHTEHVCVNRRDVNPPPPRCTGARKSPRLPRKARVDPTCASEKLLANRLINRRLDLELMQGHLVSREEKVVAVGGVSRSVYIAHALAS
jgi:hypothetical protein